VDATDPTLLFDRRWKVTIDTIEFENLDCEFKVEKTLKPAPNNCDLTVYNLTKDHQAQLEALSALGVSTAKTTKSGGFKGTVGVSGIPCKIEAGYAAGTSLIWLGDLRTAETTREGPDWVTRVSSGDGEKGATSARLHISYGPKTSIDIALRAMAKAMGVGEGNLSKVVNTLRIAGAAVFPTGITISGPVWRQMQNFAQSADLQLSIQDGALQFQDIGKALAGSALELKSGTGLLDSPTVDNEGILTAKTRMIPGVRCGGLVVMNSLKVKGNFRIEKLTCDGSTFGDDWGWTIQGKRY
jgi:hypothetical protein